MWVPRRYPRYTWSLGILIFWAGLTGTKKYFFVAIRLAQKWESTGFQYTWDIALEPTYFFLRRVCHTPSSVSNLNNHLPRRALFLTSRSWMPNPPWSLGRQTTLHLASRYFFLSLSPCQKILIGSNPIYVKLLSVTRRRKSYIVPYYYVLNLWGPIFHPETAIYLSNC